MKEIKELRENIDIIDEKLMKLLERRMKVSKEIGLYKLENNLDIENRDREKEILFSSRKYQFSDKIEDIYKVILDNSKNIQKYDYFLVGKTLSYSFSKHIYKAFGLNSYNLYETNDFKIIKRINFKGINITNPYKDAAYEMCNQLSNEAVITKVVNTILKKDNQYYGYNTDFFGFHNLLDHYKVDCLNKKVIIIGNGATAKTIYQVLLFKKAKNIVFLVRNVRRDNEYLISDYPQFNDYEVIINTTPYGTYPSDEIEPLFPLGNFNHLQAVIDVVYNPINTPLIYEARKYKIKAVSGLYMLVSQAAKSLSIYLNQDFLLKIDDVYKLFKKKQTNIILIGMPFAGKSTLGRTLSFALNKDIIDIDVELAKQNLDLKTVIKSHSLSFYRETEAKKTIEFSKKWDLVIATGGGIVLNEKAMRYLKNNGIIIFVNTSLEELIRRIDGNRPLVKNKEDLIKLYHERIDLYHRYADIIIDENYVLKQILEKIYEQENIDN